MKNHIVSHVRCSGLIIGMAGLLSATMVSPGLAAISTFQAGVSPTAGYTIADNDIRSTAPTTSEEPNPRWNATGGGAIDREVAKFNISALPVGAIINNVSLTVYWNATGGVSTPTQVDLYRATKDFTEGNASWTYASNSSSIPWTTPGGDFDLLLSTDTAGSTVDKSASVFASTANFVTAAQAAYAGDGFLRFLLKADVETGSGTGGSYYAQSSEQGAGPSFSPLLSIQYSLPVPEPGSLGLIVLGGLFLAWRKRAC